MPGQLVALMLTVIGLSVALVVISTGKPTGTLPWPDVDERGRRGTKAQTIRKGSKALLAAARPLAWVKRRICRGISSSAIVGARRPKNPKK